MIATPATVHFLAPRSASLHLATVSVLLEITSTHCKKTLYIFAGSYLRMSMAICSLFFRQEHACPRLCELPGICEIATKPQSIESTFVGRHTKFQYTKVRLFLPMAYNIPIGIAQYTQEARRINCIVSIDADKLVHDGPHVHSRDPKAFHFCEAKCKHCEYYCTLPLSKFARSCNEDLTLPCRSPAK
jgi:hypothetical protein